MSDKEYTWADLMKDLEEEIEEDRRERDGDDDEDRYLGYGLSGV